MQISFNRAQTTGNVRAVIFKLHARIHLDEEEKALVDKYKFDKSVLIDVFQPKLVFFVIAVFLAVFFVAYTIIAYNFWRELGRSVINVGGYSVAIAAVSAFYFYNQKRETIYVKDLLHGRYFKCRSVVELARKEAFLEVISSYLRQVIESAKHWNGAEKHDLPPLPPEMAKSFILKGPLM